MPSQCTAFTKKGPRCRRAARPGSDVCAAHSKVGVKSEPPRTASPDTDLETLLGFLNKAREDLLQLGRLKGQFCQDRVGPAAQRQILDQEKLLERLLESVHATLAQSNKAAKTLNVDALRQAFDEHHKALTRLIVTECSVKLPTGRLANLRQALRDFLGAGSGKDPCKDAPRALREWAADTTDRVWKHKQLLCSRLPAEELQAFRPGQVLWDGYEVVLVDSAERPRWIAVAQRRATADAAAAEAPTTFLQRLVEAMEGSRRLALQMVRTVLGTLDYLLRTAAAYVGKLPRFLARMIRQYYKYALVILVAGLMAYPALLKMYPPSLEKAVTTQVNDAVLAVSNPYVFYGLSPAARELAMERYLNLVNTSHAFTGYFVEIPAAPGTSNAVLKEVRDWVAAKAGAGDGGGTGAGADMAEQALAGFLATLQGTSPYLMLPMVAPELAATRDNAVAFPPKPLGVSTDANTYVTKPTGLPPYLARVLIPHLAPMPQNAVALRPPTAVALPSGVSFNFPPLMTPWLPASRDNAVALPPKPLGVSSGKNTYVTKPTGLPPYQSRVFIPQLVAMPQNAVALRPQNAVAVPQGFSFHYPPPTNPWLPASRDNAVAMRPPTDVALPPKPLFPPTPPPPPPAPQPPEPTPPHLSLVPVGGVHDPRQPFEWRRGLAAWRTPRADGMRTGLALYASNRKIYKQFLETLRRDGGAAAVGGLLPKTQANLLKAYLEQHPREAKEYIVGVAIWRDGIVRVLDRMAAEAQAAAEARLQQGEDWKVKVYDRGEEAWLQVVAARDAMHVQRRKLAAFMRGWRDAQYYAFRMWLAADGRRVAAEVQGFLYKHYRDPAHGLRSFHQMVMDAFARIRPQQRLPAPGNLLSMPAWAEAGAQRPLLSDTVKAVDRLYRQAPGRTKETTDALRRLSEAVVRFEKAQQRRQEQQQLALPAPASGEVVTGVKEVATKIAQELGNVFPATQGDSMRGLIEELDGHLQSPMPAWADVAKVLSELDRQYQKMPGRTQATTTTIRILFKTVEKKKQQQHGMAGMAGATTTVRALKTLSERIVKELKLQQANAALQASTQSMIAALDDYIQGSAKIREGLAQLRTDINRIENNVKDTREGPR